MNKDEKKALLSFLFIYVGSAMLFICTTLYIYYNKEIKSLDKQCSAQMIGAAQKIRGDILKAYMNKEKYQPSNIENESLKFGLFTNNKELIFSKLSTSNINFSENIYETKSHTFHIYRLNKKEIPIKYIVIETKQGILDKIELKYIIALLLIISTIFISFIAYFLSKLLLKPVRQKVEHMNKFIKDSAHELNTPVSVMMMSVSMLKKIKKQNKMMNYLLSSSKQISQIYQDLHFSAFNNMDETKDELFDLSKLLIESIEFFKEIAAVKNIQFELSCEKLFITMDKSRALKLIHNLISNAIKYSNKNSKIVLLQKNSIVTIEDFGIGISQEEQERIFKRYERGNNTEGGFGIGLDIVKRICTLYDINIKLDSKPSVGTTISLNFHNIITTAL